MTPKQRAAEFWNKFAQDQQLSLLLSQQPGIYFFIKDVDGYIIDANNLTVERCGCQTLEQVIGKTDYDFFPIDLAEKYRVDDRRVVDTAAPILNMSELAPNSHGMIDVWTTNKIPLFSADGNVIGVAGISSCLAQTREAIREYLTIADTLDFIKINYHKTISIPELAELAGLGERKYTEQFKAIFKMTPQAYIIHMRIHSACELLINSTTPLVEIAKEVGFYDQSTFSKQFSKRMNEAPLAYRKRNHVI